MPPKLPKLVPWHSPLEFIQVYDWFYPPLAEDGTRDIQVQECALRRVKAWEARGKLPHAIDSTASFMQTVIRDWTGACSDQDLRLQYSMVFIRFVNGYVDAFQSSKSAKSIAYLAVEKVGMPISFVDLRHTATHDYLPSLSVLRKATGEALDWIDNNYWKPQLVSVRLDETPSAEMMSAMSDNVRFLIESYRVTKEKQIEENSLSQPKQEAVVLGRLFRELIKRCQSGDELLETLIPILLEPGMLIPKSKKMRSSVKDLSLDGMGRMVEFCWMPLMNRLHQDLSVMSSVKSGDELSFWIYLLNGMLDKLYEANKSATTGGPKAGSYLITILAWIKYLIKLHYNGSNVVRSRNNSGPAHSSSSFSSPSVSGTSSPLLSTLNIATPTTPHRPSVAAMAAQLVSDHASAHPPLAMLEKDDILDIVQSCLENSMESVSPLIRSVLNTVMEFDTEIKGSIGPIIKQMDQRIVSGGVSTGNFATVSAPAVRADGLPVEEVNEAGDGMAQEQDEDMPLAAASKVTEGTMAIEPQSPMATKTSETTSTSAWTLFDMDAWRPCPLGCLPGGILPDLSLPWELDQPPIARVML